MKTDRSILLDSSHHIVDSLTSLNSTLSLTRDRSSQRAVPNGRELKTKGYEYSAILRRPLARKMASYALLLDQSILTIPTFILECGSVIKGVPIAYKTWGHLNGTKDNVMVICHAFTGSADVEDW